MACQTRTTENTPTTEPVPSNDTGTQVPPRPTTPPLPVRRRTSVAALAAVLAKLEATW